MEAQTVMSKAASRARSLIGRSAFLPALALLALAVAGCGSSSKSTSTSAPAPAAAETGAATSTPTATTTTPASGGSSSASTALKLAADPGGQLKFDKTSLEAKAGNVTIDFTNDSPVAHNVSVATASGELVNESPTFTGGSKTVKLSLKPGTYKFYCTVPGHRQAGMEGTLTVN
jgi:plastocyanin